MRCMSRMRLLAVGALLAFSCICFVQIFIN